MSYRGDFRERTRRGEQGYDSFYFDSKRDEELAMMQSSSFSSSYKSPRDGPGFYKGSDRRTTMEGSIGGYSKDEKRSRIMRKESPGRSPSPPSPLTGERGGMSSYRGRSPFRGRSHQQRRDYTDSKWGKDEDIDHKRSSSDRKKVEPDHRYELVKDNEIGEKPSSRTASNSKLSGSQKESEKLSKDNKKTGQQGSGEIGVDTIKCPHCGYSNCDSVEYKKHLYGVKHTNAMLIVRKKLAGVLSVMQSKVSREEKSRPSGKRDERKKFCESCKVGVWSYPDHVESFLHKRILEFLNPICKVCDKTFDTQSYEEHICHLEHIKRKLLPPSESKKKGRGEIEIKEEIGKKKDIAENSKEIIKIEEGNKAKVEEEKKDEIKSENLNDVADIKFEDSKNVNNEKTPRKEHEAGIDVFNIISKSSNSTIQSANGTSLKRPIEMEGSSGTASEGEIPPVKTFKTSNMNIGTEYCELIDAYFCELCKQYISLPTSNLDKVRDRHCQTKTHLQKMMRITKLEHRKLYAAKIKAKMEVENKKI